MMIVFDKTWNKFQSNKKDLLYFSVSVLQLLLCEELINPYFLPFIFSLPLS